MSSSKFIMSVHDGVIQRTSSLAKRYLKNRNSSERTEAVIKNIAQNSFREEEIFVKGFDRENLLPLYEVEDLPLASNLIPGLQEKSNMIYSAYFNTDEPRVKIKNSEKVIYLDKLVDNKFCTNYLNKGHSWENVVNVLYKLRQNPNILLINDAFNLLKEKQPLDIVLNNLDKANINSNQKYHSGMLRFVVEHPNKKHLVVVKNEKLDSEVVDVYAINHFNYLEALCSDEKEMEEVLRSCRCVDKEGNPYTRDALFTIALLILQKNKKWTENDSALLNSMKISRIKNGYVEESIQHSYSNKIRTYLNQGLSTTDILNKL